MLRTIVLAAAAFAAAGCTSYPGIEGAATPLLAVDRTDRDAFCRDYAERTAANAFYNYSDEDGGDFSTYRQAGSLGERSYRRCLEGRTG